MPIQRIDGDERFRHYALVPSSAPGGPLLALAGVHCPSCMCTTSVLTAMIDYDEDDEDPLPLSEGLWRDLKQWGRDAGWSDDLMGHPEVVADLARRGRELCSRVKAELGPEYEVVWAWTWGESSDAAP